MASGNYVFNHTDLSIGGSAEEGGLQLQRLMGRISSPVGRHYDRMGSFTHNWDIYLLVQRIKVKTAYSPGDYDILLSENAGGLGTSFRSIADPPNFTQVSLDGSASLSFTGIPKTSATYTITAPTGTVVVYRATGSYDCADGLACAYPISITHKNGVQFSFEYDNSTGGITNQDQTRLRSVVSNRGYALLFEYGSSTSRLVSKACVINLAQMAKPSTNICPVGVPTVSYAYSGDFMTSFTDATGAVYQYSKAGTAPDYTFSFYNPGSATPYLTNTIHETFDSVRSVTSQSFSDGRSFAYSWDGWNGTVSSSGQVAGGQYTDNNGKTVVVRYNGYADYDPDDLNQHITPGPETIIDEIGRTTSADYCYWYTNPYTLRTTCYVERQKSVTNPEGDKTLFTYDGLGNVTERRMVAKPGSGAADIVTSATYPCTVAVLCRQPQTTVDARGGTTTYAYDNTHWGVLTETAPAVQVNGSGATIAPTKRYSYAQRYAWVSNGAGGYVQGAAPIWLLTSEKTCRTTATVSGACAGGTADEVNTAYDYGPDSGPNNLLLRGMTVTADGQTLRTCYGYDAQGNKISETKPNANLSVCP